MGSKKGFCTYRHFGNTEIGHFGNTEIRQVGQPPRKCPPQFPRNYVSRTGREGQNGSDFWDFLDSVSMQNVSVSTHVPVMPSGVRRNEFLLFNGRSMFMVF